MTAPIIEFRLPCSLCGLEHQWSDVVDRKTTDDGALLFLVDWHCPARRHPTSWVYVGGESRRRQHTEREASDACPRGNRPLFCATWHRCLDWAERQRILDEWAERHDKPHETPRGRP